MKEQMYIHTYPIKIITLFWPCRSRVIKYDNVVYAFSRTLEHTSHIIKKVSGLPYDSAIYRRRNLLHNKFHENRWCYFRDLDYTDKYIYTFRLYI